MSTSMQSLGFRCLVLVVIAVSSQTSIAQLPWVSHQEIDGVRRKLTNELQHLASQNYKQASAEIVEPIERGTAKRFPLQLEAGTRYAIIGACDSNCDHVQLSLIDTAGAPLVVSPEKQAVVIIGGALTVAGSYTLELAAPGCKEKVCQAGFIVSRYEISDALPKGEGAFVAHVSSERSAEEAIATYHKLKELVPDALAGKEAVVETVDLGPRGTWHRLRIGPAMSEGEALALCGVIKAARHDYCAAQLFEGRNDPPLVSPVEKASLALPAENGVRRRDPQGGPADAKLKAAGKSEQESQPTAGGRRCTNTETSCSAARRYCNRFCARRNRGGRCSIDCLQAFNLCMDTGAWSTHYCSRTGLAQR